MSTALKEDELLAEVRYPLLPDDTRFGFNEFSRRAGDFLMAPREEHGRQDRDGGQQRQEGLLHGLARAPTLNARRPAP